MSRLAKRPIVLPKGIELKIVKDKAEAKGPKGTVSLKLKKGIGVKVEEGKVTVAKDKNFFIENGFLGLYWSLVRNLIVGVSEGFEKKLTLIGVGFRAAVKGNKLDLQVGYSHPTEVGIPAGIQVKVEKATEIVITGIDKQLVGQFAATVRAIKSPEPYKGKGIRYKDEYVRKKAGKAAKAKAI